MYNLILILLFFLSFVISHPGHSSSEDLPAINRSSDTRSREGLTALIVIIIGTILLLLIFTFIKIYWAKRDRRERWDALEKEESNKAVKQEVIKPKKSKKEKKESVDSSSHSKEKDKSKGRWSEDKKILESESSSNSSSKSSSPEISLEKKKKKKGKAKKELV